ncbi:MAG TPA: hypothetical protein VEW07_03065 [Solirubrobacterales bacterium]|nr:hypothetical protein [Solirubrobacterales bacterium]
MEGNQTPPSPTSIPGPLGTSPPRPGESPLLAKLFGFAQLDFAGPLPLADGRYLARGDEGESVLVVKTLAAPAPPARRRRRARQVEPDTEPSTLPLARATAVRAFAPFESAADADRWLDEATEAEDTADVLVADGIALLNRALYAHAVAAADPYGPQLTPERAVTVRIGYGDGEEVADSRFSAAREVDVWADGASRRRRREEDLRPQERVAAVLGGREQVAACETLLLRARADLDAGREREAALQLRVGLEALLIELKGTQRADPGHDEDMATLNGRRSEAGETANAALGGALGSAQAQQVRELLEICERILRRQRILAG